LVGALALAAYGLPRTTLDLDLAVERRAQDDVISYLESRGYETLHRSEGYSNHLHSDASRGRIDFIYVDPSTADALFGSARPFPAAGGRKILVARPEHLAAMKVLAMKNDPTRTLQDLADIRFLLTLPGVDREQVKAYFVRHGLEARFYELEKTL
jgi:nucleotidyltransferase AbiEii toxin of type IV toxin-antitoxin system